MKEQLISFETAKLAKEKGFDVPCNSYIYTPEALKLLNKNRENITGNKNTFKKDHIFTQRNKYHKGREVDRNKYTTTISVPTQSLLKRWVREKHFISVEVVMGDCPSEIDDVEYFVSLKLKHSLKLKLNIPYKDLQIYGIYTTYEEALEKGLQKALKLKG